VLKAVYWDRSGWKRLPSLASGRRASAGADGGAAADVVSRDKFFQSTYGNVFWGIKLRKNT